MLTLKQKWNTFLNRRNGLQYFSPTAVTRDEEKRSNYSHCQIVQFFFLSLSLSHIQRSKKECLTNFINHCSAEANETQQFLFVSSLSLSLSFFSLLCSIKTVKEQKS